MKVFISLISSDRLDESHRLASDLESTVLSGDVERSDALSSELRSLNQSEDCITVPELDWEQLNARIRGERPDYCADFIVSPLVCTDIAKAIAFDDNETVGKLFSKAAARKLHLLQIPYLED